MTQFVVVRPGQSNVVPSGPQYGVKYTLTGPDGSRAVFNDPTDADYLGWLSNISGLDSPDLRESADDLIGDDGGVHGDFFYGRRPLVIEGQIDNRPAAYHTRDVVTFMHRNEVTNPSIELATTNYSLSGSANAGDGAYTSSRVNEGSTGNGGSWSIEATRTLAAVANGSILTFGTEKFPVQPGTQRVFFHAAARLVAAPGPNITLTLRARTYDSAGTYISSVTVTTQSGVSAGATWYDLAGSLNRSALPANVAFVGIEVNALQAAATAGTITVRTDAYAVLIDPDPNFLDYFDGGTLSGGQYPYRTQWAGTAHSSASIMSLAVATVLDESEVRNLRMTRLQRATNAMRGDATLKWQVVGGVEQSIKVRRQQPLRIAGGYNKTFQAALVAADPRLYSTAVEEIRINPNATGVAVNDGTASTPGVVTIYGPTSGTMGGIVVTNTSTGEAMTLASGYTIGPGQYIVIDFANKTIARESGANIYGQVQFASSSWWQVAPGSNTIGLTATGTTTGASMLVRWQDAWI